MSKSRIKALHTLGRNQTTKCGQLSAHAELFLTKFGYDSGHFSTSTDKN